ncbi:MAG: hypothetical protein QOG60_1966, partial [Frankiaceae bacterium]|nr:hypothetical protein [Frankiaceae bacterium]
QGQKPSAADPGRPIVEATELGDRSSVDGDEYLLTGLDPLEHGPSVVAEFS